MGTYIYSGLHPRKGTIPVHTFFPSVGGKPIVAMKSSIVIEGQSLQKVQLKEVKAIMDAYEMFLIPSIFETDQEYDYALLVENLDNDSVPDKVAKCTSKPGESIIGIVIDYDPSDETYIVGCGPQVFTNVISDCAYINPKSEFPSVQIQRSFDSTTWDDNVCDGEAEVKRLLDPAAGITSQKSSPSSYHSTKKEKVTPSSAAMPQAQSNPAKSSKLLPSSSSANSLSQAFSLTQTQKNPTEGRNLKSSTSSASSSLKLPLQQTQNNPTRNTSFKPFTGWSSTLSNESQLPGGESNLYETYGGSGSPLSRSSNFELSTSSVGSLYDESLYPKPQANSTKSSKHSHQPDPLTSSGNSLWYESLYPRTQGTQQNPFTSSTYSLRTETLTPQTQNSRVYPSLSSSSSEYESLTPLAHTSHLEPCTSTGSSLSYESLLPQAPHNPRLQHTSPSAGSTTENESAIEAAIGACSQMSLEEFEALKPTLPSYEKRNKIIEELMTVTI